uniref:Transglutaminase-like domain-containing protein n=1 Tax=Neogobius melanostomus TaxID=47308 RepID=A0A8C6WI45_9GOBI
MPESRQYRVSLESIISFICLNISNFKCVTVTGSHVLVSSAGPLTVEDVDLLKNENAAAHKTSMYRMKELVIRRGAPFQMKITFNRPVTPQDMFQVQFRIGESFTLQQGATLLLRVTPAPDAVVGKYLVVVGVALANGLQYTPDSLRLPLYVLFNAFHPDDVVYLQNQSDAHMYVMKDNGVIYVGDYPQYSSKPWNYGQFEAGVLDACIYIMDKSELPIADRGDVVKVCRMASAMINSHDDQGVLVGNWSDDFSLGSPPTLAPVSFAQCWVYAGVLNTFLRCLGLASRVITNFFSAHDNNGNLRTDLVFTADMQPDSRNTRDSIWYQTRHNTR